jgi:hypothetical protein
MKFMKYITVFFFRHLQGYGVRHSCGLAKNLYRELAESALAQQGQLQRSFELVRLRVSCSYNGSRELTAPREHNLVQVTTVSC